MDSSGTRLLLGAALPVSLAGVVAVAVGTFVSGLEGALGAALAAAAVIAFFSLSAYVVNWASKISPQTVIIAGLTSYVLKVLAMMILVSAVKGVTVFDTAVFGWTVVGLAVAWIVAEFRITLNTRKPYIDEPAGEARSDDARERASHRATPI
ncbi:hypothetical protein LO762_19285 [Actinocorallia sp. API 0066]|uniref:hypothetical protein n=1 Tax=Actinocorallia sp. API 0066 TaxID=2896846 RepID=UPI001E552A87|nr:hypothetical protein [Actinocorallia sp. API 0066]MCD0451325.1 hypothetical protein [Actinocorallia sp. API 0066]